MLTLKKGKAEWLTSFSIKEYVNRHRRPFRLCVTMLGTSIFFMTDVLGNYLNKYPGCQNEQDTEHNPVEDPPEQ